jgi:hypothetical protein
MQLQSNKDTAWEDQPPTVRGGGENASSSSSSSFSAMPSFAYFETQIICQDRLGTSSNRKRATLRNGGGRSLLHQVEHRLMGALGAKNDLLSYFYTENDLFIKTALGQT